MKAYWIVSLDAEWPISPESHLCLWRADRPIPKGWEVLEIVAKPEREEKHERDHPR